MGSMLTRAIDEAGFADIRQRVATDQPLALEELEQLRSADLLVVAGLADLKRQHHHGDQVRLVATAKPRDAATHVYELPGDDRTGADLLRGIALTRLQLPAGRSLAVSLDELGVELAQTALVFGADVLFGDLGGKRTLPLIDGPDARRAELTGLIERSGRSVVFEVESRPADLEQRS